MGAPTVSTSPATPTAPPTPQVCPQRQARLSQARDASARQRSTVVSVVAGASSSVEANDIDVSHVSTSGAVFDVLVCSARQGLDYSSERKALTKWAKVKTCVSAQIQRDAVGVGKRRRYIRQSVWAYT
jgi:uncharacterized protein YajQ (UPF0234 family)